MVQHVVGNHNSVELVDSDGPGSQGLVRAILNQVLRQKSKIMGEKHMHIYDGGASRSLGTPAVGPGDIGAAAT